MRTPGERGVGDRANSVPLSLRRSRVWRGGRRRRLLQGRDGRPLQGRDGRPRIAFGTTARRHISEEKACHEQGCESEKTLLHHRTLCYDRADFVNRIV